MSSQENKPSTPSIQDAARLTKKAKSRQKNERIKLKREQVKSESFSLPTKVETSLQKLQKLIDEMEEYQHVPPSKTVSLKQYIPWEELGRKIHLKNWLFQLQKQMQQYEDAFSTMDEGNKMF